MSEWKKLYKIKGFDEGSRIMTKDMDGYVYRDDDKWLDEDGANCSVFVSTRWYEPIWKLYEEPEPEYEDTFYELRHWGYGCSPVFKGIRVIEPVDQGFLHYVARGHDGKEYETDYLVGVKECDLKGVVMRRWK